MSVKSSIKELEKQLKALKATAAAEAAFKRMSKPQKRVAIAKDVIASLRAQKLFASSRMGYLRLNDEGKHKNFQTALAMGQTCTVCALGGLFTCAVKVLDDEVKTEVAENDRVGQFLAHDYLSGIFTKDQLEQIEAAFEKSTKIQGFDDEYGIDEADRRFRDAVHFGELYTNDTTRMIAIMKNIIRNEGTFKPYAALNDAPSRTAQGPANTED